MTHRLEYLEIDSSVFGFHSWMLDQVSDSSSFASVLDYVKRSDKKSFVTCKIQIDRIDLVHAAEQVGFSYVETQFQTSLRIPKEFDLSRYPYDYVRVETRSDLNEVLDIAAKSIEHDRFSRDPLIGKVTSGERYCRYLENSFDRDGDEIWSVRSRQSGKLLTFRSHRIVNHKEVSLLIGGVHPAHKESGLGVISSHFCFSMLKSSGFTRANTHISAANLPIVNLEVGHFGFRIVNAYVVLRTVV